VVSRLIEFVVKPVKSDYNLKAVTIEAGVSLTTMPTEVTEETGYGHYHNIGGILEADSYGQAFAALNTVPKDALENPDNGWWRQRFHSCTLNQVRNYSERARITLSGNQTFLFCYLRELGEPSPTTVWEKPVRGAKVCTIGDQPLLAEVLLMTDDIKNLHQFEAANPVVFPPKQLSFC